VIAVKIEKDHVKRTTKAALLTMLVLSTPALAQTALPHVKTGQCSGGYRESGGFCVPKSERSAPAVPKVGQCPSGWASGAGLFHQGQASFSQGSHMCAGTNFR
jgi:hypothetical protein